LLSGKDSSADEMLQPLQVNYWRRLRTAAYIALATHFVAGLAMVFVLRQGLDTADFGSRITFLTGSRYLWIAGWLCWNLASLSILYFYTSFVDAHKCGGKSTAWLLRFALLISIAAVAADLSAESIEMGVIPDLAWRILSTVSSISPAMSLSANPSVNSVGSDLFLAFHRAAMMMTGCIANGLYTISAACLVVATRREYNARALTAGTLLVIGGAWLSVACLLNSVTGMVLSNVLLLTALLLWLAEVAGTCRKQIIKFQHQNAAEVNPKT
jgi:hypothetical protein